MQSIYVYKPSEAWTNSWVYYRIASVDADVPAGTLGAPIEVCKVAWPTFEDIPPAIDTPGITGYASAWEHQLKLVLKQWDVDHDKSTFIGFLLEPKHSQ
jgi:hypothetical protein